MNKKCFKCGNIKDIRDFYKHKMMSDGHLNKCKECTKNDVNEHRKKNLEKIREYDRRRGRTEKRIKLNTERTKEYRKKFPLKYKAHSKVNHAIKSGTLIKPDKCSICGFGGKIEAHHDDYHKPLDVVWVCSICHKKFHY